MITAMHLPDVVNGAFELLAAIAVVNNCWTLWQHKKVHGVSVASTLFFCAWGFWNLFYYPHLGQFWSLVGGVAVTLANLVYIGLMLHFTKAHKRLVCRFRGHRFPPFITGVTKYDVILCSCCQVAVSGQAVEDHVAQQRLVDIYHAEGAN